MEPIVLANLTRGHHWVGFHFGMQVPHLSDNVMLLHPSVDLLEVQLDPPGVVGAQPTERKGWPFLQGAAKKVFWNIHPERPVGRGHCLIPVIIPCCKDRHSKG